MANRSNAFKLEKEFLKTVEMELKAIERQMRKEKPEAQKRELKQRLETIIRVTEIMLKQGTSEQSIHILFEGLHEYMKPVGRSAPDKPGTPQPMPGPK